MSHNCKWTQILAIIMYGLTVNSYKKKEAPVLTTAEVTDITGMTAKSGGTMTAEGSGTIISRGVCWSTGTAPMVLDNNTSVTMVD